MDKPPVPGSRPNQLCNKTVARIIELSLEHPDFATNLNVRYSVLHRYVTEVVLGPLPYIDLTYLGDIDLDTFIINDGKSQVYVMIDQKSRLLTEPYMLMFAVR